MSGIINKVKDALHVGEHSTTTDTTGTHHGSTTTGTHHGAGPHASGIANVADPRVDSTTGATTGTTTGTHHNVTGHHTAGPHNSDLLNKADPRVDSDRDGSTRIGGNHTGTGLTGTGTGVTGTGLTGTGTGVTGTGTGTGLTGTGVTGTGTGTGVTGSHLPHDSQWLNKVDPRVDESVIAQGTQHHHHHHHAGTGVTGTTGTGLTGTGVTGTTGSGLTGNHAQHTAGPHNSDTLNRVDPRVDSDRDGSNAYGVTGQHGAQAPLGQGAGYSGTSGSATNTAGPHKSGILNKLDPRVDSDLDGSRTAGGNYTYSK